jgi:hypothetical protein
LSSHTPDDLQAAISRRLRADKVETVPFTVQSGWVTPSERCRNTLGAVHGLLVRLKTGLPRWRRLASTCDQVRASTQRRLENDSSVPLVFASDNLRAHFLFCLLSPSPFPLLFIVSLCCVLAMAVKLDEKSHKAEEAEVSNCVSNLIHAFSNGLNIFKKLRERRRKRKGRKENQVADAAANEEKQLSKSLKRGPQELAETYDACYSQTGKSFAKGDGKLQFPT